MTTTDSSFVAQGPAHIGFYAKGPRRAGLVFGALTVGSQAGVCGATVDALGLLPPATRLPVNAGVLGLSDKYHGVYGYAPGNPYPGFGTVTGGVFGSSDHGFGVRGLSNSWSGVYGESAASYGVSGWSQTTSGMYGQAGFNPGPVPTLVNVAGVVGSSDQQAGVIGTSQFVGVYGYCGAPGPMMNAGNGVEGHSANGTGVVGVAGAPGPVPTVVGNIAGVIGSSDQHTGIIGTAINGVGVVGYSETQIGVYGETDATGGSSYAGYFKGNLYVTGQIFAGIKDAIVPFPDGTHRVLHCMESPEHWFEDFGAGKLKRGRAVVKLDTEFAKVIKRDDYKVFLTPEGDCRGLYVRKSAARFEVREFGGGTSSIAFSYRIVGRRRDIRGHRRFDKIEVKLPVFPRSRRPVRGKRLARIRKQAGALSLRGRGRRRGKRA